MNGPFEPAFLRKVRDGDVEAREAFMARLDEILRPIVSELTRASLKAEIDDLVAESIAEVWKSIDRIPDGTGDYSIECWLRGVVIHRIQAHWRRITARRRMPPAGSSAHIQHPGNEDPDQHGRDPVDAAIDHEMQDHIQKALASLDTVQADLILLSDFEGLPLNECAERLGLTISQARTTKTKAHARLAAALRQQSHPELSDDDEQAAAIGV